MLTFHVTLPAPLGAGEALYLNVLDEVTGLAFNAQPYVLTADDATHYSVILPFPVGAVLKYRYTRQGSYTAQEHLSDGRAVRYRLYHVTGPAFIEDVVSRWTDTLFSGPTGRISGQVIDAQNGLPIPNILIAAGGAQTLTNADGAYLLEGLPPGLHNLAALALDGSYRTFQQGAMVAADSTTPAALALTPAPLVNVVFTVSVPANTPPGVSLRLAGSLAQTGNTFADLSGGANLLAARMPTLGQLPDGRYNLVLTLPAGADLQYKYTLGDGLWSAERSSEGGFRLRRMIVPEANLLVEDTVDAWSAGAAPITFDATAPANTPPGDNLSIQFNPGFDWMAPIPMITLGGNRWTFTLTGPLENLPNLRYRYCRADQCGSADEASTAGPLAQGRILTLGTVAQTMAESIGPWAWVQPLEPATVPSFPIKPREPGFIAGIEFQPNYHPSWSTHWPRIISEAASLNPNWLLLTPTWSYTRQAPPVLELLTAADPLWPEIINTILLARNTGLSVGLFPTPHFPGGADAWWSSAPRDFAWWVAWFDRYRTFVLHHADLAARSGAQALVLGGEWAAPALPGGKLGDGNPASAPEDAEQRWRALITEARTHFGGPIWWALPYPDGIQNPPPFLDAVDLVYIEWSAPLSDQANAAEADLAAEAGRLLDADLLPFQQKVNRQIVLGVSYPSVDGGIAGCLPAPEGGCLALERLSPPNPDLPSLTLDLAEQKDVYNALLTALNDRDWIGGFVSRGYYPPVALQDKSASVHGKPAAGVLWYWYQQMLGK
jgi:hypothetical protein